MKKINVVFEGLKNNQDIKAQLKEIGERLIKLSENETSHLADIGAAMRFHSLRISQLAEDTFKRHAAEKNQF